MTGALDEWVTKVETTAVVTADSSMRRDGVAPPVTAHVLSENSDPPYVGLLICRACEPGSDTAVAIASMGALPAALAADRVVVCWEHVQLSAALEVPGAQALTPGIVVLDARRTGHAIRFRPMRLHPGPVGGSNPSNVVPEWGQPCRPFRDELPEPIARLLRVWRTQPALSPPEVRRVLASLDGAGYGLRLAR